MFCHIWIGFNRIKIIEFLIFFSVLFSCSFCRTLFSVCLHLSVRQQCWSVISNLITYDWCITTVENGMMKLCNEFDLVRYSLNAYKHICCSTRLPLLLVLLFFACKSLWNNKMNASVWIEWISFEEIFSFDYFEC